MAQDISKVVFPHTGPIQPSESAKTHRRPGTQSVPFDELLRRQIPQLKFSAHAQERMRLRGLALSDTDCTLLQNAVDQAAAKGACDSLVLLRDMAFVVSVRNRTVITAIDGESMRENVFTNIDSAVIV